MAEITNGKVLVEVPVGFRNEVFRITEATLDGKPRISIRVWYRGGDGELLPSKGPFLTPAEWEAVKEQFQTLLDASPAPAANGNGSNGSNGKARRIKADA